jgi:hydrogenase/urease accessory protein HupE
MIKTILFFLAVAFILAYLAGTKINIKPFSIKFTEPVLAVGVILIGVGLLCCYYSFYAKGYEYGRNDAKRFNNITGTVKNVKP